uniref:Uncharacterized protein n=1 Tax=Ditylum brightwellii TaxID=49249 RepID=A0A6U3Q8X8_9STRA|mmetsp:Transcript_19070/g.28477  ORF Transcript_19070/g.28477 Transcript_19070/m.28477 type:complete len:597 (+) Transcript_19070:105-1895(+)
MEHVLESRKSIGIHTTSDHLQNKQLSSVAESSVQSLKRQVEQKQLQITSSQYDDPAESIAQYLDDGTTHLGGVYAKLTKDYPACQSVLTTQQNNEGIAKTAGSSHPTSYSNHNVTEKLRQIAATSLDTYQNSLLPILETAQNRHQQHPHISTRELMLSMLLSQSTAGSPVNKYSLPCRDILGKAELTNHIQDLYLAEKRLDNDFQTSNFFGDLSHQLNTVMSHNAGSSLASQIWGNGLISAANRIYNPLQLSVTPPDYPKPSFVATKSQESNLVQRALRILYPDQDPSQEVNILPRQLQDPLLTAESLLSQTSASALSAHPSIISGSNRIARGISTVIPNDHGRNKTLDDDKFVKLSNTYIPPGKFLCRKVSSISNEDTSETDDSSVLSSRSDFDDYYHEPNTQKRKRRFEEYSDHKINAQRKKRRMEDYESDSTVEKSSDTSNMFHGNILVAIPDDSNILAESRCIVRSQIEFFSATKEDARAIKNGRSKLPEVGQVGIRCIHCKHLCHQMRPIRAAVFPSSLDQIYMAVKNWQHFHFSVCIEIPQEFREKIVTLSTKRKRAGGSGRAYWVCAAKKLGIMEYKHGLCFGKDPNTF